MKKNFLLKLSVAALSLLAFLSLAAPPANAQILNTLYSFSGGSDGANPQLKALAVDAAGNFYGTTMNGGINAQGAVVELVNSNGAYSERVLHTFTNLPDGAYPSGGVIIDSQENLFGATQGGGTNYAGTVFELSPSAGSYNYQVLYSFGGPTGPGTIPFSGLTMDGNGNLFGTTYEGGASGGGSVYELAKGASGYTAIGLYSFTGAGDGNPEGCH